jgi:hypothetical protein
MRRLSARLAVTVCALVLAGPAIAYICHPDASGTRSLALRGRVVTYSLRGEVLTIGLSSRGLCNVVTWDAGVDSVTPAAISCGALARSQHSSATATRVRFRLAGASDGPDRIQVRAADGYVRSWPLPVRARPGTLAVSRGLATYLERDGTGLWVMRLGDGRTTFVGPTRPGDRPLLGARGLAYQDNVYKRRPLNRPLLKFVPTSTLRHEVGQAVRPLHTGGPIRAFSVDGTRVALVVGGRAGRCDRVVFWNAPWRSVEQVSEENGPTCGPLAPSRRISSIAPARSVSIDISATCRVSRRSRHSGSPHRPWAEAVREH